MSFLTKLWAQDKGRLLLAVWLILTGALPLLSIANPTIAAIMQVLAIAAGVLLLWR